MQELRFQCWPRIRPDIVSGVWTGINHIPILTLIFTNLQTKLNSIKTSICTDIWFNFCLALHLKKPESEQTCSHVCVDQFITELDQNCVHFWQLLDQCLNSQKVVQISYLLPIVVLSSARFALAYVLISSEPPLDLSLVLDSTEAVSAAAH